MSIPRTWQHWFKALVAAAVTGGSNALLTSLGITGAQMIGIKVDQLSGDQLLATLACGALVGTCAYLKQSPVPPDEPDTKP